MNYSRVFFVLQTPLPTYENSRDSEGSDYSKKEARGLKIHIDILDESIVSTLCFSELPSWLSRYPLIFCVQCIKYQQDRFLKSKDLAHCTRLSPTQKVPHVTQVKNLYLEQVAITAVCS